MCSAECDYGVQRLVRECDKPRPEHGGLECRGEKKNTKQCFVQPCPGECLVLVNHMATRGWLIYYKNAYMRGHVITGLVQYVREQCTLEFLHCQFHLLDKRYLPQYGY